MKHNAVNLGQGFIDYDPPKYHMDIYDQTVNEHKTALYQYTRGFVTFLKINWLCWIGFDRIGSSTIGWSPIETLFVVFQSKIGSIEWNSHNRWSVSFVVQCDQCLAQSWRWSVYSYRKIAQDIRWCLGNSHRTILWLLWTHGSCCWWDRSRHSTSTGMSTSNSFLSIILLLEIWNYQFIKCWLDSR